jgi:hypothetical protein
MPDVENAPELQHRQHSVAAATRRIALWLFLSFACFYALCSSGRLRTPDEYMTLFETESIVMRHSTAVPQALAAGNFYGTYDHAGQPRAPYPPGQALLATPWYALGRYAIAKLPGVPANDRDFIFAFTTCLSSAVYAAAAVAFALLILAANGVGLRVSLYVAALIGLATPLFAYSSWFFSEPLTTMLLMAAAYALFGFGGISRTNAIVSGLLLGAAVLVRPTNGIEAVIFFAAILVSRKKFDDRAIAFALAVACGVALLLAYNTAIYGRPWDFGYPSAAEGGRNLNSFHTPVLHGLAGFLLSPGKSIFLFAPPLLAAIFGMRKLWNMNRGLCIAAACSLPIYLLFFAKLTNWEGGYCFGPRYMVPALALFCLSLGPALEAPSRRCRFIAVVLGILGFAVEVVGMATSFLEDQAMTGRYYDANWSYRFSYSLRGQLHLLIDYLTTARPAPLGLGFDRWFVFLGKAGIADATLLTLAAMMAIGLAVSLAQLRGAAKRSSI